MTLLISFTPHGAELARRLEELFPGAIRRESETLSDFLDRHYPGARQIVFIGACGIAVRALAKRIAHKAIDPAVLVIDEAGRYVISLLSGHLGGANQLARQVAEFLAATPVITTASDVLGLFSIDDWARQQGLFVANPEAILAVAKKVLAGERLRLKAESEISGQLPDIFDLVTEEPDVVIGYAKPSGSALHLIAPIVRLGSGCRKQLDPALYAQAMDDFLNHHRIHPKALSGLYSITLKQAEPAMLAYARDHKIPFIVYRPEDIADQRVSSQSDFVASVTGIDNVCERCANYQARPLVGKTILPGATAALGLMRVRLK